MDQDDKPPVLSAEEQAEVDVLRKTMSDTQEQIALAEKGSSFGNSEKIFKSCFERFKRSSTRSFRHRRRTTLPRTKRTPHGSHREHRLLDETR